MLVIVDPRGMQIASNVMNQHDGSLRVEFVPATVGQYLSLLAASLSIIMMERKRVLVQACCLAHLSVCLSVRGCIVAKRLTGSECCLGR